MYTIEYIPLTATDKIEEIVQGNRKKEQWANS